MASLNNSKRPGGKLNFGRTSVNPSFPSRKAKYRELAIGWKTSFPPAPANDSSSYDSGEVWTLTSFTAKSNGLDVEIESPVAVIKLDP